MQRFICNQEEILNHIIINNKEEIHHIKDVCRLRPKDKIELINGKGMLYAGSIVEVKKDKILVKVESRKDFRKDKKPKITLACAIPKNVKMDDIVHKVTQLGVDIIIPLKTKRTIVDIKKTKEEKTIARWQKIARQTSKQSKRIFIPEVEKVKTLHDVLNRDNFDLKLIPTLEGHREELRDILKKRNIDSVLVLIGPEGDFTQSEIELAKKNDCVPVSMGDFTLKVDTAATVAVGLLSIMLNSKQN